MRVKFYGKELGHGGGTEIRKRCSSLFLGYIFIEVGNGELERLRFCSFANCTCNIGTGGYVSHMQRGEKFDMLTNSNGLNCFKPSQSDRSVTL